MMEELGKTSIKQVLLYNGTNWRDYEMVVRTYAYTFGEKGLDILDGKPEPVTTAELKLWRTMERQLAYYIMNTQTETTRSILLDCPGVAFKTKDQYLRVS